MPRPFCGLEGATGLQSGGPHCFQVGDHECWLEWDAFARHRWASEANRGGELASNSVNDDLMHPATQQITRNTVRVAS